MYWGSRYLSPSYITAAVVAAVLVTSTTGAPSIASLLLLAALFTPAGVAFVTRSVITKVIHLSRLLEEEEGEWEEDEEWDEEEDEDWEEDEEDEDEDEEQEQEQEEANYGDRKVARGMVGRRGRMRGESEELGQEHGRGEVYLPEEAQECEVQSQRLERRQRQEKCWGWMWMWRMWREGEHENEERQDDANRLRTRGGRERRIDVEWDGGQLFLVIRRPVASEFLVSLVNRYMHGPIPMKVESCRADVLRVCLSPMQILRQGSFQATVVGLRTFGRRTHEDEWDEGFYYEKAIRFHRWAADYVQALIEGTYGRKMKVWGGIVDSLINNLVAETKDMHLRIDDRFNGHSFGLFLSTFAFKPGVQEPQSLGATPHEFVVEKIVFYVDPHNEIARSPQCTAMTVDRGTFRVEFPDIFRTLILNREIMPGGRGKRLRVRGDFTGIVANIQANQVRTYLFSLLGTFCPYKYSAWKATIREQAALDCRPLSTLQRRQYLDTFGTIERENALNAAQKRERAEKIIELERHMSYRDMLLLRKEARGWLLEDMGDELPPNPPLDPEFMEGVQEDDKQYAELAAFAARVQGLKLAAWEKSTCLREIMVETVIAREVEFRLYSKAEKGPEDKTFKGPLQAVMLCGKMEGRFRMFIARTKASNRLHSRGANGVDGEPTLPWLMAGGTLQHPVVLDEATAARFGYGSTCVLGPAHAVGSTRTKFGALEGSRQTSPGGEANGQHVEGGNDIPAIGGCFRMWSDYRMALEGHASNVQAGTLLPPVLDMAKTVADTFRRRWAAGGQYPERTLARVRLAERGKDSAGGDSGNTDSGGPHAVSNRISAVTVVAAVADDRTNGGGQSGKAMQQCSKTEEGISLKNQRPGASAKAATGDGNVIDNTGGRQDREGGPGLTNGTDDQPPQQQSPRGGLQQVFSRLDGLDSGTLAERALEDHLHGEVDQTDSSTITTPSGHAGRDRSGSGRRAADCDDALQANSDGALSAGLEPGTLSAALDGALKTPPDPEGLGDDEDIEATTVATLTETGDDDNDVSSVSGREGGVVGEMETPAEEKFMLPGWHYLSLSGRQLSIDLRWTGMDLVLMQDPTARQGRNTGKNVLALRTSGTLTVSSSGVGESVDVQLRDTSLLPCFYTEETSRDRDGGFVGAVEKSGTYGPAQCLALILGGGERAQGAVARTWLGQGLVPAITRPLLEPFTVQIGYGTVVAHADVQGRGTGVTDGRRQRRSSGLSGHDKSQEHDDESRGLMIPSLATGRRAGGSEADSMSENGMEHKEISREDPSLAGNSASGVFRVAVSELQLLGLGRKTEEIATVEVKVADQTRSFLASHVMPVQNATTVGDRMIELEFSCRCRLRRSHRSRRLGQRRESVDSASALDMGASSMGVVTSRNQRGETTQPREGDTTEDNREEVDEEKEAEEDVERTDAEPEVSAGVRLVAADGEVLGEALAELAGAPNGWARYPLYSAGSMGADTRVGDVDGHRAGSGDAPASKVAGSKSTGLDRGGVIPPPPPTVRRRWGWRYRRDTPAKPRRWFRPPPPPRDVAGEIKLRLGWVPSGLAVRVHRYRARGTAATGTDAADDGSARLSSDDARRRRTIILRAEPGGGSARAYPLEVEMDDKAVEEDVPDESKNSDMSLFAVRANPSAEYDVPFSPGDDVVTGDVSEASEAADNSPESLFFVLDTSCLLAGWGGEDIGGDDGGGDFGGGDGARLVLSMNANDLALQSSDPTGADCASDEAGTRERLNSTSPASAELLLFPGSEPARRWVRLTDVAGDTVGEVDVTIAWAVAPPLPTQSSTRRPSSGVAAIQPNDHQKDTPAGDTAEAMMIPSGSSPEVRKNANKVDNVDKGDKDDAKARSAETDDEAEEEAARKSDKAADNGGLEAFPEPAQVVSRCFSMHASDLVLRVSDLDVAVLVTMAKGIVRILRPPKSKEEKELEQEAVQQRLLEEANNKRKAAIQQLRAIFQSAPGGEQGSDGVGVSVRGGSTRFDGERQDHEELLNVKEVVELLRDFLRAKALTESEISREAEEFMLVILAVEDEAKSRTPMRTRARSASPTNRRRSSEGSPTTLSLDPGNGPGDITPVTGINRGGGSSGGGSYGSDVASGAFSSRRRWRTRLRPEWRDVGSEAEIPRKRIDSYDAGVKPAMAGARVAATTPKANAAEAAGAASSATDSMEGFICPQCRMKLHSPAALLAHFHVFHGTGVYGGGGISGRAGGGSEDEEAGAGSAGPGDVGDEKGGWYSGDRRGHRRSSRRLSRRGSWRGVSISLDHFILALQSFMEEHPDEGNIMARCEEFASEDIERRVLAGYPSLPHRLAATLPNDPLPEFWGVMKEAGATQLSGGEQQARVLQTRMVRAFKSYRVARIAWAHLVVPALFGVPRCGAIKASSGHTYLPMPCPIREGQSLYVDKPGVVITHLPPELGGARDAQAGDELGIPSAGTAVAGGEAGGLFTGIMAHSKDRGMSGVRAFLTFTLDRPAVVYVCYDRRLKRIPVWLLYFESTDWVIHTTDAVLGVWRRRYRKGKVRLGCNEGWRKGCAQYVVLFGQDIDAERNALDSSLSIGPIRSDMKLKRHSIAAPSSRESVGRDRTSLMFPSPTLPTRARGLLPDGEATGGRGVEGGRTELPSPRWVLRPMSVAGGKGSLAQAVRALIDERRKSRAKSRSQLLPGGTSRAQLDAAATTAAELGLELASVELQYTAAFDFGRMSFHVVDPSAATEDPFHVKAELCLSHASGSLALRHLHPGDWLGKPDSLTLRVTTGGVGTYYNPHVDKREHLLEPWSGLAECHSERGDATTQLRLEMPEHLVVNVSPALVENIKDTASLVTRNWAGWYTEPSVAQNDGRGGGVVLIRNTLGVEVVIQSFEDASYDEGSDGFGLRTSGEGWESSGSDEDFAPAGLPNFFKGDTVEDAAADPGVAAIAKHPRHLCDISRPTAIAAGQAIEFRLPVRTDWTDSSAVAVEFVVQIPGFQTVTGVRVGGRGTCAYPLVKTKASREGTASKESKASKKARGVAERFIRAPNRDARLSEMGLALVVDVGEKNSTADVGSTMEMRRTSTQTESARQMFALSSTSCGGLVAELRTNVCVHNASASNVEIDMADITSASAGIAKTLDATRSKQLLERDWGVSPGGAPGGAYLGEANAAAVRLAAGARLALPLSVLSSWQLRIAGDATNAWSRPLRLSPALLDPAVPNALRLTSDMERNSICLRLSKSSGQLLNGGGGAAATAAAAAAARGELQPHESGGDHTQISPSLDHADEGHGRKSSQRVGFSVQHSPKLATTSTSSRAESTAKSPPTRLPATGMTSGMVAFPGTADWVLIVQPSYLITNALPCAMEVEVLQPLLGAGGWGVRSERSRSSTGSELYAAGLVEETDIAGERSGDAESNLSSDDDSDTMSITSSLASRASRASRQTQQSEGKGRVVVRMGSGARASAIDRAEAQTKAKVRNPALDLFFLPSSNSVGEVVSRGGGHGGAMARRGSDGHDGRIRPGRGVDEGGGISPADGGVESGKEGHDPEGGPIKQPGYLLRNMRRREEHDPARDLERVWKGLIGSGQEAKVGRVDKNRPFYVRVRLPDPSGDTEHRSPGHLPPPCSQWSDCFLISTADYGRRSLFNARQPQDITWRTAAREDWGRPAAAAAAVAAGLDRLDHLGQLAAGGEGRTRRQQCPEIKAARSWGRSSARRLTFYAPYWVVNKTGLALNYRARYGSKSTFSIRSSEKGAGGSGSRGDDGRTSHPSGARKFDGRLDGGDLRSGAPAAGVGESRETSVSSKREAARAQVSRLLLREATYVSDEDHLGFFGGRSLPVMLACPSKTLEVMPYALAARAENAGLCVCDLQVDSDFSSLYRCITGPRPGSSLYTDCSVKVVEFPKEFTTVMASRPRSAVQILTPWREPPAPEKEAFMTFWLTREALVHVCMDSRTPASKLPSWLEYAGFRKLPGAQVQTSEPGLSLQVFRRFFRAKTLVRLGGSDNGRDLAQALTDLSGAAVNPDGPAPKGMLANFTVLLTTVPPPPRPPASLSASGPIDQEAAAAAAAAVSACEEEADVRDALVDRDMTESIICRRRYRILPDFSPGDRPYVDRDYTIPSLPIELQGLRLTCVQTAQGDKRAGGSRLWRLTLMQESTVLVVFDARAQSVPLWLSASGFALWEGVKIAGAQYRIPYVYNVYRKTCDTGLVWLGGNGARGCKGAKRGYFVLVHVAKRNIAPLVKDASAEEPGPSVSRSTIIEGEGPRNSRSVSARQLPLHRSASEGGDSPLFAGFKAAAEMAPGTRTEVTVVSTAADEGVCQGNRADTDDGTDNDSILSASFVESEGRGQGTGPLLSSPTVRRYTGSCSVEYVQDANTSPHVMGGLDAEASSGGGGNDDGDMTDKVQEKRPRSSSRHGQDFQTEFGSRNRGRLTIDAAELDPRSVAGTGSKRGSNGDERRRERAWTGGEEVIPNRSGGSVGVAGTRAFEYGGYRGSAIHGRSRDRSRAGLQRISALWNTEKDGPLSQMPVPFDRVGRSWSRMFNVDAVKTGGPLETSGATLGVSVSALPGQFHRTRVVTLYPRLIVRNFLGFPLEVMPTVMSPKAAAVERLSRCIPPAMPPFRRDSSFIRTYHNSPRGPTDPGIADVLRGGGGREEGSGGVADPPVTSSPASTAAAVTSTDHLAQAVPNSANVIVYAFNPAHQLVKGLAASAAAAGNRHSHVSLDKASAAVISGDSDDRRNCVLLRASAGSSGPSNGGVAPVSRGVGGNGGGAGGFGPALESGLSRPVLAEEMGETHLWVVDSHGRRHLAAAFVSLQRATVFITLSASAQFPPFRVENRSSAETLAYRQVNAHKSMGWHILPPLSWHAFLWQEPDKPRAIQMAFASSLAPPSTTARHSEEYSLDKIGVRDPLEEESITRSVITRVATGVRVKSLFSEVRVEGRARVLSFGDVRLSDAHEQGHADSVTRFKRLYNQLDIGVRFAGLSFNIVESSPEGPFEMMSAHVDSVTVAKRSGDNAIELQVFHVQVDDMRRRARMPVVLQPADSGFNSHLRDGRGGASWSGGAVPFVRLLWDKEVETLGMPHLKSLDLELQEMRANVDLEFALHLLDFVTSLVPELTSEEVLAKMCRKKAKLAIRHTVPTPAKRDLSMVYVEAFRHSTIVVRMELWVGQAALSPDAAALEDPEAATGGLTVLSGGFLNVLSVVGSSIAHVNPTFVFDELVVTQYCGSIGGLTGLVVSALTQQAVAQGYKLVGSMELLGDPLSLVSKVGDSVVQFFTKTKAEMTGDADTVGAGAKSLVKGLVGGTFGSAAKITGSLEGMIRGLSGTAIAENGSEVGREGDGQLQGEVKDLEHGVKQGGKVFYETMKAGITGLIDRPAEGAKEEGFAGFIAGMAKGIVGAVAAPVAGALGAVSRVTEGVDASTRLSDEKRMGRRRAARTAFISGPQAHVLSPLTPTDLVKNVPRKFATLWVRTDPASVEAPEKAERMNQDRR